MMRNSIPDFAKHYPAIAETMDQARLTFYCCNCYRKSETEWVTEDFGPVCDECMKQLKAWRATYIEISDGY